MKKKHMMPAIFVGHGSPTDLISDNAYTQSLSKLGLAMQKPKAIMVISAHWLTQGTFISYHAEPEQIYDFYGFPEELYTIKYKPRGAKEFADLAVTRLPHILHRDTTRGLDHACWGILKHMYPDADVPVFALSLDASRDAQYHYDLGRKLSFLREEGILVIGSGNIVHNPAIMRMKTEERPYRWAVEFDSYAADHLLKKDHATLVHYKKAGLAAEIAVKTNDHYLPLLYVAAMQRNNEKVTFFYEGFIHASISMRSFVIS